MSGQNCIFVKSNMGQSVSSMSNEMNMMHFDGTFNELVLTTTFDEFTTYLCTKMHSTMCILLFYTTA